MLTGIGPLVVTPFRSVGVRPVTRSSDSPVSASVVPLGVSTELASVLASSSTVALAVDSVAVVDELHSSCVCDVGDDEASMLS